ncbi:MAG TPA: response regulator transcription factor [Polyangiaceae bacterium]|nr:response regulator transcription factor [Polyangiaceae bacterium]
MIARDPLVRSGLVAVLSSYPGLVLKEAVAELTSAPPAADVLVWDAPEAPQNAALSPVLALVTSSESAELALRAGARGALSRSAPLHAIAPAALAVAAGHWVLGEEFAAALLTPATDPQPAATSNAVPFAPTLLSPREQEVLSLLSEGLSNRDIAGRLGISHHTSKFHVNAILDKLGATTRTEAVVLAARSGLLTL